MLKKMRLIAWMGTGPTTYHLASWRYPTSKTAHPDVEWMCETAQLLEQAAFDAVFFADSNGLKDDLSMETGGLINLMDPTIVGAAIARATSHIGIGITVSTSFVPPYAIARSLGTLDYISGGRVGWNIVTSGSVGAREFGIEPMDKSARYGQAAEYVELCKRLWESFPPAAIVADQASGRFIDVGQIDRFDFRGEYVKGGGPLNAPLSKQGGPVIIQAGGSEDGRDFAAEHADLVFVMAATPADIRAFVEDLKRRVVEFGREENAVQVVAAVNVIVAETEEIAQRKWRILADRVDPRIALQMASNFSGLDLASADPDSKISEWERSPDEAQSGGIAQLFEQMLQTNGDMTVLQAALTISNSAIPTIIGDPEQVTDQLAALFEESTAAGFMISSPIQPAGFEDFARLVVPRLQQRGLFRTGYRADTLRGVLTE